MNLYSFLLPIQVYLHMDKRQYVFVLFSIVFSTIRYCALLKLIQSASIIMSCHSLSFPFKCWDRTSFFIFRNKLYTHDSQIKFVVKICVACADCATDKVSSFWYILLLHPQRKTNFKAWTVAVWETMKLWKGPNLLWTVNWKQLLDAQQI